LIFVELVLSYGNKEKADAQMREDFDMLKDQIEDALNKVRPSLQADGGDVEFVDVDEEGVVRVRLTGACGGCPMSQMTLKMGIEKILKQNVPQINSVVAV
jgi:Fe-S cluster biogenesis protein NfuA